MNNLPNEIIRHIYGYIGDVNTVEGISMVLKASSGSRAWRDAVNPREMVMVRVVGELKRDMPCINEDLTKLESVSSIYEDTIIRVNESRPVISQETLKEVRSLGTRIGETAMRAKRLISIGKRAGLFDESGSMINTMLSVKRASSNTYLLACLTSMKNVYKASINTFIDTLNTFDEKAHVFN